MSLMEKDHKKNEKKKNSSNTSQKGVYLNRTGVTRGQNDLPVIGCEFSSVQVHNPKRGGKPPPTTRM